MIHLNGTVESLVPYDDDQQVDPWEITNGARGYNRISRHIVYVGGKGGDTRTAEQELAMIVYIKELCAQQPQIKVVGHNQLDPGKSCPSFDVPNWLSLIGVPDKHIHRGMV